MRAAGGREGVALSARPPRAVGTLGIRSFSSRPAGAGRGEGHGGTDTDTGTARRHRHSPERGRGGLPVPRLWHSLSPEPPASECPPGSVCSQPADAGEGWGCS